jgi:hypothetical protein
MDYQTAHLTLINQLFELEKKLTRLPDNVPMLRPVGRMWAQFAEMGYVVVNPQGEPYTDTRTDCEASIAGESLTNLRIETVVKPAIYHQAETGRQLLQKAVVVVVGH